MKTQIHTGGKKTLHVLNDLIRINMDRIAGFEKAAHEDRTPEPALRDAFYRMAIESRSYVNDLHARVIRLGGAPVTQATITGKIYLHWLEGNQDGEATEKAYHQALDEQLPNELHELIENQLWALERAHHRMQELWRDRSTHA
ncbi:PA2169 family four-helix-bundle protein [Puia sp.]|jgi:uncharacterized protein (TIGR02284 family)|uniref:PA2169 family four-helix-bundle protein n=1 Tax=Puia sp. TaxID=2045100 RepID=UPI002F3EEC7C